MRETCLAAARGSMLWALLCTAPSPLPAAETKTITRQEAQTLPVSELAERMLGASAAAYSEVERPGEPSGMFASHFPELMSLRFATSPRWSHFHGLCVADTLSLGLVRTSNIEPPTRNSPVVVNGVSTARAYRFIGPAGRGKPSSDSEESSQEQACRKAGPVFHPPGAPSRNRFFYGKSDYTDGLYEVHAYFAGWALETARHALTEGGDIAITCAEDPGDRGGRLCAEPSRLIRQLELADISFVALERCDDDPSTFCAEMDFMRPGSSEQSWKVWRIALTTDATRVSPLPEALEVRKVSMEAYTVVE